jgi:Protein of unknown function (DUF2844)
LTALPVNQFTEKQLTENQRRSFKDALRLILPAIISAAMVTTALPAFAALGGDAASVQADQAYMHATLRTTQTQAYTLHEIQAPTGTVVREYVSPASGQVFGVAWQGPWPPDMRQILGDYFGQYQQAMQAQATAHAGRHPVVIELPGLVLQSSGHMRSFSGRAYIPNMLPQNISAEAIR